MIKKGKDALTSLCNTEYVLLRTDKICRDFADFLDNEHGKRRTCRPIEEQSEFTLSIGDLKNYPNTHKSFSDITTPYFRCKIEPMRRFYYGTEKMNFAKWHGIRISYVTKMITYGGEVSRDRIKKIVDVCSGGRLEFIKSPDCDYIYSKITDESIYPIDVVITHEFIMRQIARIWSLNVGKSQ